MHVCNASSSNHFGFCCLSMSAFILHSTHSSHRAKMADGVLTVAASAAPPPPPGGTDMHLFDPLRAPPPPPSIKSASWTIWKREKLFSFTEAVCSGEAGEGHIHRDICTKFLDEIGQFKFIYGVGTVAPLCDKVCWHSCNGDHTSSGQDHDDFTNCPQPECAESLCYNFLIRCALHPVCTIPHCTHTPASSIGERPCTYEGRSGLCT